jgi:parvulin-like peptidyl-prolyl isomerase
MRRWALVFIAAGIFPFAALAPSFAQDTAPIAPTPATAAASSDKKVSSDTRTPPKPKKVWTNDDMAALHANSTVSVVGPQAQGRKTQQRSYYPNATQSESMVRMYRQQIDQLQAQVDSIDKQIASLRDAIAGKTVDSSRTYDPWGGRQGDWSSQIDQLQKNRESVLKQIDTVDEQIRKLNP